LGKNVSDITFIPLIDISSMSVKLMELGKPYVILPLALILCFMVGCQVREAMAELEEFRAQAEVEEQNKALVERIYEELNKRNVEIIKELYASDYGFYSPSNSLKPRSREETIESGTMVFRALPDSVWSIKELYAVGDRVIVRFVYSGTHEGEFMDIPPTGNKIEVSGIIICRIENGKIVEEWEDADMLGFMQQLGMEMKPKEGEK
jgi:steroid delta-isomerase-like uncharacterized protein